MEKTDIILQYIVNNECKIKEIDDTDYEVAFCYLPNSLLMYSKTFSAIVVNANKNSLDIFIKNILLNKECHFDYVIEDFGNKTGIATFIYKNNFIYYTMYDDVFSNPFDFAKIKVNDVIVNRLKKLSQLSQ